MPQSEFRIDQKTQWRLVQDQRAARPALKREPRRPFEGVDGVSSKLARQSANEAGRPAIERIGPSIPVFRAVSKLPPLPVPREPHQYEAPHGHSIDWRQLIRGQRFETAARTEPGRFDPSPYLLERAGHSFSPRRLV